MGKEDFPETVGIRGTFGRVYVDCPCPGEQPQDHILNPKRWAGVLRARLQRRF